MKTSLLGLAFTLMAGISASCGGHDPSPEALEAIEALRNELAAVDTEVSEAEAADAQLSGGLVDALVQARLQLLGVTRSLIQQRIHALESGAEIDVVVSGTEPDSALATQLATEMERQRAEIEAARREAEQYSGGLIHAMAMASVATQEQTLAMLRQRHLAAKYGLAPISVGEATSREASPITAEPGETRAKIIEVRLLRKRFAEQDYQDYIWLDVEYTAAGIDKPTRAIKGTLALTDLFGEPRLRIGWTIDDSLSPGATAIERGVGFEYNQFTSEHTWARSTELDNMKAIFLVESILYQDGSRTDFDM